PPVHVVAIAGEVAYLPCDITPSQDGDSVQLVLWFQEGRPRATDAIYSLDSRDDRDRNMPDHWSDPSVFSKRAHFTRERKPAELGVDHIREDEAGLYRCRVEFRDGPTRNSKVNLTVIGECAPHIKPTPPSIYHHHRFSPEARKRPNGQLSANSPCIPPIHPVHIEPQNVDR
ncbi:hypothetical protein QAD02_001722, partial [Eretmocerus hayati]